MADQATPPHAPAKGPGETQDFDPRAMQENPLLGAMVGHYHVTGMIGRGSHGTVYRARDIQLDRTVALKVLRFPDDPAARKGLLDEARTIVRLGEHPNIVPVYVWGEFDGNCYFAQEYFETSVAQVLHENPEGLEEARALAIIRGCAEGLAHAHGRGLLHLDIKPANVLIDRGSSRVKLCDFGLARFYAGTCPQHYGVSGSPAFMSPEQIRGETLGPASDVFSLGVMMYQLLCGRLPFEGTTVPETTDRILSGPPAPIHRLKPDLAPGLAALVNRCLAPTPEARFASARALADAITEYLAPPSKPQVIPARSPVRTVLVFTAALVAVVLGGIVLPLITGSGGRTENIAEADGRTALERGDYAAAVTAYRKLLDARPEDDHLLYGLGYACLLARDFGEAEAAFSRIDNPVLADEGRAATAQAKNETSARAALEESLAQGGSAYAGVLLAIADLADGQYAKARDRLTQLNGDRLEFDWQRARLWQTLGQAHFKLGELAQAREAFERLGQISTGAASETAEDYLAITQQQLSQSEYEQLSQQITRVRTLRENLPPEPEADPWTSRPMRLWIAPATAQRSVLAVESGLADVLPWKLSKALLEQEVFPVGIVDREYTAAILREQELSAQLASQADAAQLGRLLGARLALFCRFNTVLGEEALAATLVDVETSKSIPIDEAPVTGTVDAGAWIRDIAGHVARAIEAAYPLRGMVRGASGTFTINIGSEHGLKPGMRLVLMSGPGTEFTIPDLHGVVQAPVGSHSAPVLLEGPAPQNSPETGWYAEVITVLAGNGDA